MMNSRFMYPGANRFKKTVGESFLLTTRNIYKNHPFYKYDDDEALTKIMIELSYSNSRSDGKNPRFTVKVGSYNKDLTDTLASNMSAPIYEEGVLVGYERRKIIRVPITVIIHSYSEEECSDLADELSDIGIVFDRGKFSMNGIVPVGVHVSETDIFDESQKLYQTTVTFTVDVPWVYSETSDDKFDGFDFGGNTDEGCCEIDDILDEIGYRTPGITVFRKYIGEIE